MSELQGIARFKIHEGKLDEFKRLRAQVMEILRTKDTGTLQYDTYFNDDRSECSSAEPRAFSLHNDMTAPLPGF